MLSVSVPAPVSDESSVIAFLGNAAHPLIVMFARIRLHRRASNVVLERLVQEKLVGTSALLRCVKKFRIYDAAKLELLPHKKGEEDLFSISFS